MALLDIINAYDVTQSQTFLMLETCQADYANGNLIVTSIGEISDQDWAFALAAFPIPDSDYSIDCLILEDGIHVLHLNFNQ